MAENNCITTGPDPRSDKRFIDLTGRRFGKLVVERWSSRDKHGDSFWECRCDCGTVKAILGNSLKRGLTNSCGCGRTQTTPLMDRVRARVEVTATGCWIWTRKYKYGKTTLAGKTVQLHRAIWEATRGPIPDNICVCHNCPGGDNPQCCNPDHMFLGTHADNHRDAAEKDMVAFGNVLPQAKITPEVAAEIFTDYHVRGIAQQDIAAANGIARETVGSIIRRETWRRATEAVAGQLGLLIPTRKRRRRSD